MEEETKDKLKHIVAKWDEQAKNNKQIKLLKQALENKTIDAIQNFTDEEVSLFLHLKWIEPVCEGVNGTLNDVLTVLEASVRMISEKYGLSYKKINEDLTSANKALEVLVNQLTGDEFTINGLTELIKE